VVAAEVGPAVAGGVLDEHDVVEEEFAGAGVLGPALAGVGCAFLDGGEVEVLGQGDVGVEGVGFREGEGTEVEDGVEGFNLVEAGFDFEVNDASEGEDGDGAYFYYEGLSHEANGLNVRFGIFGGLGEGSGREERDMRSRITLGDNVFAKRIEESAQFVRKVRD
jgi:hypothetical protein